MKNLFLFLFVFSLVACNSATKEAAPADLAGFTMVDYSGTSVKKAIKVDANGQVVEEGEILDGKKTGTWITYLSGERPKTIANYVNGLKNGLFIEFNDRGQITWQTYFNNDEIHGRSAKFALGSRLEEEAHYKMGKLDGAFKTFDKKGNIQREIYYKDGQLDGPNIFYSEDGKVTMQYEYKNGEKISGGLVEGDKK